MFHPEPTPSSLKVNVILFSLPVKRMYLIEGAAPEQGLIFE
jgi:hypothetical protein